MASPSLCCTQLLLSVLAQVPEVPGLSTAPCLLACTAFRHTHSHKAGMASRNKSTQVANSTPRDRENPKA